MAIGHNPTKPFEVIDRTSDLLRIPTNLYTISSLGLFQEERVNQSAVLFEEQIVDGRVIVDQVRGTRGQAVQDRSRKLHTFPIPHFPLDAALLPRDVIGKSAYGNLSQEDSLTAARLRKMEDIARAHAWTKEIAMAKLITTGDIFAPSGTVSHNWYSEFGVSPQTQGFDLNNASSNPLLNQEVVIDKVATGLQNGSRVSGVLGLCSTSFFNALVTHPKITAAYANWTNRQDPTRSRVGTPVSSLNRTFEWGGILYQEVKDKYNGAGLIPDGECYFVPTGTDIFKMYYAPAERFDLLGTSGESMYMFEYTNPRNDKIEIETETNFACAVMSPQAIVKGTVAP